MKHRLGPKDNTRKNSVINEKIKSPEIRLIGDNFNKIMRTNEALQQAKAEGLDLICITPHAKPPVCKIMDFGKYLYQLKKKKKESSKNQLVTELKEIQFRPTIDIGDIKVKTKKINGFLAEGHKVKLIMQVRGREQGMKDFCYQKYENFVGFIDKFEYDTNPKWQGNKVLAILKKSSII